MRVCWIGVVAALATAAQVVAQVESRRIEIPAGRDGATEIPVTTIRGSQPGPTVAFVAGNHGYEYPPILATQRLRQQIDPKRLRGTVILVHIANVPSFLGRTIYFSPVDQKNLNRVYPGKPDGTVSERIAHAITEQVIAKADYVLDLHAGDGNEDLRPYVYQAITGEAAMDAKIEGLARAFGIDHIVLDRNRPKDPAASLYCSTTAITRGKPAITVESGYLGNSDEASVARVVEGARRVLAHLKMTDEKFPPVARFQVFGRTEVVTAPATGVLEWLVKQDQTVTAGHVLARIRDYFGQVQSEVKAPFAGKVLYIVATPPMVKGQPVAFLGEPVR